MVTQVRNVSRSDDIDWSVCWYKATSKMPLYQCLIKLCGKNENWSCIIKSTRSILYYIIQCVCRIKNYSKRGNLFGTKEVLICWRCKEYARLLGVHLPSLPYKRKIWHPTTGNNVHTCCEWLCSEVGWRIWAQIGITTHTLGFFVATHYVVAHDTIKLSWIYKCIHGVAHVCTFIAVWNNK